MEKENEGYVPLTHEELVADIYRMMYKMPLEMQAALAQKVREAAEMD